ncbi:MAG: hypothetical protein QOH23_1019 [Gaiellaceae bacterium]|jgi:hypothetical protein|nr:hypothetical protein [Gaiellaceae bacterium]
MIRKHLRLKKVALALAIAAVAAPTAQAAVYVDGPTPGVQAGYIRAASHQKIQSEMSVQSTSGPGITAAGAALANARHTAYPVPNQVVSSTDSSSFSWSDAGIGASVSFGAALLLLTAVGLGRRARSRGLASV